MLLTAYYFETVQKLLLNSLQCKGDPQTSDFHQYFFPILNSFPTGQFKVFS